MSAMFGKLGMGWLPDYPDFRDYTIEKNEVSSRLKLLGQVSIKTMLAKVGVAKASKASLPASMDLRAWFSPIEDQEQLGSCTANAGVGMVEYFERRAFGRHIDASRLFLYKITRNMSHWTEILERSFGQQWAHWRYLRCRQKSIGHIPFLIMTMNHLLSAIPLPRTTKQLATIVLIRRELPRMYCWIG